MVPLTPEQRALAEDNLPLAHLFVRQSTEGRRVQAADRDELESDALLALVQAARYYQSTRARFSTYAKHCVCRAVCQRRRRQLGRPHHGLDGFDPPAPAPESDLDTESGGAALASLPPRQRQVLTLRYFDGGVNLPSLAAVGRQMGLCRERVRQAAPCGPGTAAGGTFPGHGPRHALAVHGRAIERQGGPP